MFDSHINTSLNVSRVQSCLNFFISLFVDGSGKESGCGSTVSGLIVSLVGDILDESSSDVGSFVGEIDCLGDSNSVLCDLGRSVALIDENVAASGSESDLDRIGELFAAFEELFAGLTAEEELLCSEVPLYV